MPNFTDLTWRLTKVKYVKTCIPLLLSFLRREGELTQGEGAQNTTDTFTGLSLFQRASKNYSLIYLFYFFL